MTAPIVFHQTRSNRLIRRPYNATATNAVRTAFGDVPGQLWSRVAEGRKQVWS
jgi:hypothetical protein